MLEGAAHLPRRPRPQAVAAQGPRRHMGPPKPDDGEHGVDPGNLLAASGHRIQAEARDPIAQDRLVAEFLGHLHGDRLAGLQLCRGRGDKDTHGFPQYICRESWRRSRPVERPDRAGAPWNHEIRGEFLPKYEPATRAERLNP